MDVKKMYLDWLDENIVQEKVSEDVIILHIPLYIFGGTFEKLGVYVAKQSDGYIIRAEFRDYAKETKSNLFCCKDEIEVPYHIQEMINDVVRRVG